MPEGFCNNCKKHMRAKYDRRGKIQRKKARTRKEQSQPLKFSPEYRALVNSILEARDKEKREQRAKFVQLEEARTGQRPW